MIVLDSDFLIDLVNGMESVKNALVKLTGSHEEIATTIFNAQEILFGTTLTRNADENYSQTLRLLESVRVLEYDWNSIERAVRIRKHLRETGRSIGIMDEMISAICMANGATIATRNVQHFSKIEGLDIISW